MSAKNRKKYGKLRPSEIVLSIIAVLMLLGWGFHALDYAGPPVATPVTTTPDPAPETTPVATPETTPAVFPWFATFSVPSAVLVLALIFLKLNCISLIPGNGQEKMLPYISLLPVLGFLIAELGSVQTFLTVGGAVALAYISATSYWRNYIPEFITNPLGTESESETAPQKTPPPATPPAKKDESASATPAKEDEAVSTTTAFGEESSGADTPSEESKKETSAETSAETSDPAG